MNFKNLVHMGIAFYLATPLLAVRDSYQPCQIYRSVLVATAPIDRGSYIYQQISSCR